LIETTAERFRVEAERCRATRDFEEVDRRLKMALIVVAGALLAAVVLLRIEMLLIDWGNR
jgi:hypothetical protein